MAGAQWADMVLEFNAKLQYWQWRTLEQARRDQTSFLPPIILCRTLDSASLSAAWIIFEHVTIDEWFPDGCWKSGTFRYTAWFLGFATSEAASVYNRVVQVQRSNDQLLSIGSFSHDIDRIAVDRNTIAIRDAAALRKAGKELSWVPNWLHIPRPS